MSTDRYITFIKTHVFISNNYYLNNSICHSSTLRLLNLGF